MVDEVAQLLESQPHDVVLRELRKRLQQLGAGMANGQIVPRAEADALAARVVELVRGHVCDRLLEQPCEALALLDLVRNTGYATLEPERPRLETARRLRYPPPSPVAWREIEQLRQLAAADPEHCTVGPPADHVAFASQLGAEMPADLLALYAACTHFSLGCRHVRPALAAALPAGDRLTLRDGRIVLFDRKKRHPALQMLEQPGLSIMQALGTWWLVLEDAQAPAIRRPLDLQGMIRFALMRQAAPDLEVLVTDLAWHRFFA
jgi:hypothetical protein